MKSFKILFTFAFVLCFGMSYGQLTVDSDDEVGVGTSSPIKKLHVSLGDGTGLPSLSGSTIGLLHKASNAGINSFLSFIGSSSGSAGFYFGDESDENAGSITYRNSVDRLELRAGGAGTDLVIASNGNVGVGTLTPGTKLTVNGDIAADNVMFQDPNDPERMISITDVVSEQHALIIELKQQVEVLTQELQRLAEEN